VVPTPRRSSLGAYGFRLAGIPGASEVLVEAPHHWPQLELVRVGNGARPAQESVTGDSATLWLPGGASAELDRAAGRAELHLPEPVTDRALVHPYLAPVALVMSRWMGREGFHGGGIVAGGGVWAVLGIRTAGKSTMLAWLATLGVDVVCDDVLLIDGEMALAGPRTIDLREEAAQRLDAGEPMGRVGARERWRLSLGPIAAELPLRGWITLEWGDAVSIEHFRGAEKLAALIPHRGVRLPPTDPAALVRFTALPHVRFTRPRDWDALPAATDRLLDALTR
jgi:hypothetical protein